MKKLASIVGAIAIGLLGASVSAEELKMLISFPKNYIFTQEIGVPFAKLIEKESAGELTVKLIYPDAIPPFQQFEPVQAGAFDMLFTHASYHAGITTLGMAADGIVADPAKRRQSGVFDYLDEQYKKIGMRVIGLPPMGTKPLRFYVKKPIAGEPSFRGRKIRAPVIYHPMIEALGGAGVVTSQGEIYAAVQSGVVDGVATAAPSALELKLNEVLDYFVEQPFGSSSLYYLMNAKKWDSLSEKSKSAITRAAIQMENMAIARMDFEAADERKKLIALGMKSTRFSDAEAAKLDSLWANSVWAVSAKGAPEATARLREIVRKAGLSD